MPPPFRPAFNQAQMVGVKRHRRKSSCDRSSSSAVGSVQTYRPAGALGSFGANGQPYFLGAVSRFKCGLQHGKVSAAPDQLGVLCPTEAFAPGQQPDGFQQVGFALPVCPAQNRQLRGGFQNSGG